MQIHGTVSIATRQMVFASCLQNELTSLECRHLRPTPPIVEDISVCYEWLNDLKHHLPELVRPVSMQKIVDGYTGMKKRRYVKAMKSLYQTPVNIYDARVKMFVKVEKIAVPKIYEKAPRAIQYRSPRFTLKYATFMKPIEQGLYSVRTPINYELPWCAKEFNSCQRAEVLLKAWDQFDDPVAWLLDHKYFDSCVVEAWLKLTHKLYQSIIGSDVLVWCNKQKYKNVCTSKNGIKWVVKGTRMSGEYDTGSGNGLINYSLLREWVRNVPAFIFVDGDDSVIITEKRDLPQEEWFLRRGFQTKMQMVERLIDIEFCQAKLNPYRRIMMKDPVRSLSRMMVSVKRFGGRGQLKYLTALGKCEQHAGAYLPLVYAQASKWASLNENGYTDQDLQWAEAKGSIEHGPPEHSDRLFVQEVYGIPVSVQLHLENQIKTTPPLISHILEYLVLNDEYDKARAEA